MANLIKLCNVDGRNPKPLGWSNYEGDFTEEIDSELCRKIYSIKGAISATNYLRLSLPITGQTFNSGSEMYIIANLPSVSQHFSIHIILANSKHSMKLSLSNSYKNVKHKTDSSILIPLPIKAKQWTLIHIPLRDWKATLTSLPSSDILTCRSVQICSCIKVRGVWLQDYQENLSNLSTELAYPIKGGSYKYITLNPSLPFFSSPTSSPFKENKRPIEKKENKNEKDLALISNKKSKKSLAPSSPSQSFPFLNLSCLIGFSGHALSGSVAYVKENYLFYPSGCSIVVMNEERQQTILHGHTSDIVCVASSYDGSLAASGQSGKFPLIRIWDMYSDGKGCLNGIKCIGILGGVAAHLSCLDISLDKSTLVASGTDSHGKSQVCLWDISKIKETKRIIRLLARGTFEYSINRIVFSPYEASGKKLVSVGRENIRFWRVKTIPYPSSTLAKAVLPCNLISCPVSLVDYNRSSNFTDVAFESSYGARPVDESGPCRHIFISSEDGTVLQINNESRELDCVFRLHDGPITSISVNEGFCVTGSSDLFLRVWPLDFSDYFLEAKHEGSISSVCISSNGLQVAVGSSLGTLGLLDVSSHKYTTLLRSHRGDIFDADVKMMVGGEDRQIFTVGQDGTIRVWGSNGQQLFEFKKEGDTPSCVAAHPFDNVIVCGFFSGDVCVYDVHTTSLIYTFNQHRGAVSGVYFTPDSFLLFSFGLDQHICVFNVLDSYTPIKMLDTKMSEDSRLNEGRSITSSSFAISPDGYLVAAVCDEGKSISIYNTESMSLIRHVQSPTVKGTEKRFSFTFQCVCFSFDSQEIIAAIDSSCRNIARYQVHSGNLIQEFPSFHNHNIKTIACSPCGSFIVSGGLDKVIKVWNLKEKGKYLSSPLFQSFIGNDQGINRVKFSNDGSCLLSVGDSHQICVWGVMAKSILENNEPNNNNEDNQREILMIQNVIYNNNKEDVE